MLFWAYTSLANNCLMNESNQRSLEDCSSFYAERGLNFDNFGAPETAQPPTPGSTRKKNRRLIQDLANVVDDRDEGSRSASTSFWAPPPPGFTKMNFDAVLFSDSGKAGMGVIMRGGDGSFLFTLVEPGMARSAGVAECLVARYGLLKAHDLGLRNVYLEGDCKRVITYLLSDELVWPLDINCILSNCKSIMSFFDSCLSFWVKRPANNVTHVLASKGLSVSSSSFGRPLD